MSLSNLKNVLLNEDLDIKIINKLKNISKSIGFSDTLFVSSAGDNSDGSSWDKAYTSLTTALDWIAANQSSGEQHLVVVGVGTFDINTTGNPTYDENIVIMGSGKYKTIIKNDHASATSVLKLTGVSGIFNLDIYTGTGSNSGILVNGSGANGFEMENVLFSSYSASGSMDCILIDGTIGYITINNCQFDADTTNSTAIHLNGVTESNFNNIIINEAAIAIHLDHTDDDDNNFCHIRINDCAVGIQIDNAGAANNNFHDINFIGNTTNIDDSSTTTEYIDIKMSDPNIALAPSNLTGQVVVAGVGANTYGTATQIRSAASATKPFYVVGMTYEVDTAEKWTVKLSDDGGTTAFWEGIVESGANVSERLLFEDEYLIRQGTAIHGTVKSETGSNNIDIWINIKEV